MEYLAKQRTMHGERCSGADLAHIVVRLTNIGALIVGRYVAQLEALLVVQNTCTGYGYVALLLLPEHLWWRITTNRAMERSCLAIDHSQILGFFHKERLDLNNQLGIAGFARAQQILGNAPVVALIDWLHIADQQIAAIHNAHTRAGAERFRGQVIERHAILKTK